MIKRNQNWIFVVVGTVGSGKTYAALECADDMMDRKLDPNMHVVFSITEFMIKLNANKFKRGDTVVFEEAGVNISSKNWQSHANKNINFVLQTCRHRNFAIGFTLPMYKFLDSSTRALIHTVFIADEKNIDYKTNTNYLTVYDFKTDALRGTEPYIISPKFWVDSRLITMKKIAMKMPSEEILDVYEKRKTQFTDELNKRIEEQLVAENRDTNKKNAYVSPCPTCLGINWRFYPSKEAWVCRKCGEKIGTNPFKK